MRQIAKRKLDLKKLRARLQLQNNSKLAAQARMQSGYEHLTTAQQKLEALESTAQSLSSLELESFKLVRIPPIVLEASGIQVLNLRRNFIRELPATISRCTILRELSLGANKLPTIPAALWGLSALTALDLGWNRLKVRPNARRYWMEGNPTLIMLCDIAGAAVRDGEYGRSQADRVLGVDNRQLGDSDAFGSQ